MAVRRQNSNKQHAARFARRGFRPDRPRRQLALCGRFTRLAAAGPPAQRAGLTARVPGRERARRTAPANSALHPWRPHFFRPRPVAPSFSADTPAILWPPAPPLRAPWSAVLARHWS